MVFLRSLLKVRVSIFSYLGHFPGKIFTVGLDGERERCFWTLDHLEVGCGWGWWAAVCSRGGGNADSYPPPPCPVPTSSDADPAAQSAKLHAGAHFIVIKFWRGVVVWTGSSFSSHCALSCWYLRPTQDLGGEQKLHVSPKEKDPKEAARPEASPPSHSLE